MCQEAECLRKHITAAPSRATALQDRRADRRQILVILSEAVLAEAANEQVFFNGCELALVFGTPHRIFLDNPVLRVRVQVQA